jgi:CRISPR/Cas system-associated exonuclease Cas4 (RecB family)
MLVHHGEIVAAATGPGNFSARGRRGALCCRVPSIAALRLAPWSLSKIQCALRCPLEFHLRYVDKLHEPEVAPETRLGKAVHAALEGVLTRVPRDVALGTARKELMSEEERARFDEMGAAVMKFVERIDAFRARRRLRHELIEHRLAVTFDFSPTEFVARDVFFRGVWDAGYLFDDGLLAVVDHKTGVRRAAADYASQLEGYAALAAANLGHVKKVWLGVHFVPDAAMEWTPAVELDVVRREFVPRVLQTIEEAAAAASAGPVAKVSTWCQRCSYKSICPTMRAAAAAAEALPESPPELVDDAGKEG